jgi:hypothetical protein
VRNAPLGEQHVPVRGDAMRDGGAERGAVCPGARLQQRGHAVRVEVAVHRRSTALAQGLAVRTNGHGSPSAPGLLAEASVAAGLREGGISKIRAYFTRP